jgi:N-acyl-L-homoserine lactone synthetase
MPHIVAGPQDALPPDIRRKLGIFRHKIFVQRLGWALPGVKEGTLTEWDQFDVPTTVHLVALIPGQAVCGCARLMPTTGPYLLGDIFPELVRPNPPPASPAVWELSRFAGSGVEDSQVGTAPGMRLFPYALALASTFGATRVIGVMTRSVARLYRQSGVELHSIGPTTGTHGQPFLACAIELTPVTFARLRCDPAELLDSLTWFGPGPAPVIPSAQASCPQTRTTSDPARRSVQSRVCGTDLRKRAVCRHDDA